MTDINQPTPTPPTPPTPTPSPTPTPAPTPPDPAAPSDAPKSLLNEAIDKAKADPKGPKDPDKPAPAGAPEKYADFTLPEGVELTGEVLTKATALFKDMGLTQEQAQSLVDFHVGQLKGANDGMAQLWQDTQDVWVDELRSDPVIGKGIENGTVGASIAKMISSLPAPQATAFREAMNLTGAGNNPAIVRGFYELSKKFAEPGHVQGNAPAAAVKGRPTAAEAMYPSLVKKE